MRIMTTFVILLSLSACDAGQVSIIDNEPVGGAGQGEPVVVPTSSETRDDICDNGWDDDADGEVDEGCPCRRGDAPLACYPTPEKALHGICKMGKMACQATDEIGLWGECKGAILPQDEDLCLPSGLGNGIDEDCDGQVDEGCCAPTPEICGDGIDQACDSVDMACECDLGAEKPCFPEGFDATGLSFDPPAICRMGVIRCVLGTDGYPHWDTTCDDAVTPKPVEECKADGTGNGIDEDCNGETDETCNSCDAITESCTKDSDCSGDTTCNVATGLCTARGDGPFDDTCTQEVTPGIFSPRVQCQWLGPPAGDAYPNHKNVLGTPVVIDFDFDSDASTIRPSIAFLSYDYTDGGLQACAGKDGYRGVIRIIDGETCEQQATISSVSLIAAAPLAVADLDLASDHRPEIAAARVGGGITAFKYNAVTGSFDVMWDEVNNAVDGCHWAGPSIHDLDDDGYPEVLQDAAVHNGQTGALLTMFDTRRSMSLPVAGDVDGDGAVELVWKNQLLEWNTASNSWTIEHTSFDLSENVALGDFGTYGASAAGDDRSRLDGVPEVFSVYGGRVRVETIAGRVVYGPITLPPVGSSGTGGPPTISDFDGDGRVEAGVAGRDAYTVFDPDCVADGGTGCASGRTDGILWSKTTKDHSSSRTGSSVFDFEHDGKAEVVYGDECYARVYDGTTGDVLFSQQRRSCTWLEYPVVADVDGDFNSEIVITGNSNCTISCPAVDPYFDGLRCVEDADCPGTTSCVFETEAAPYGFCRCSSDTECGGNGYVCSDPHAGPSAKGKVCLAGRSDDIQGVRVMRDASDRWVNSRPIWNQHAYSVTNVDDRGVVPKTSEWVANWSKPGLNNFRQNIVGDREQAAAPDLTVAPVEPTCVAENDVQLRALICNRGTEPVAAGVPVTFFEREALLASPVCATQTVDVLSPGTCEQVNCTWADFENGDLEIVVDDNTVLTEAPLSRECKEDNNSTLYSLGCTCLQ